MNELSRRRPHGLGRGLSSLLGEVSQEASVSGGPDRGGMQMVAVASIEPNRSQPMLLFRARMRSKSLRNRSAPAAWSSRSWSGRMARATRSSPASGAGARRNAPGCTRSSMLVRELNDIETFELALVENIQRQDLNAIEEADGYRRLVDEYGHTQEELGRIVGKSRSHIANLLRLLDLPEKVRVPVASGKLSMGHARALIGASDPASLADDVIRGDLSVRETERLAAEAKPARKARARAKRQQGAQCRYRGIGAAIERSAWPQGCHRPQGEWRHGRAALFVARPARHDSPAAERRADLSFSAPAAGLPANSEKLLIGSDFAKAVLRDAFTWRLRRRPAV